MYVCAMPMGRQLGRAAATPTRPHLGHLRLRLRPPRGALLVLLVVAAAAKALVPAPRLLRRSSSTRWTSHGARATCRPHNEDHRTDPPPSIAKPLGMLGHGGSVLGAILRGEHVSGIYLPEVRVLLAQSNTASSRPMLRRSDHHHGDTRDHPKYERHPGRNRIHWH